MLKTLRKPGGLGNKTDAFPHKGHSQGEGSNLEAEI